MSSGVALKTIKTIWMQFVREKSLLKNELVNQVLSYTQQFSRNCGCTFNNSIASVALHSTITSQIWPPGADPEWKV